MERNEVERGIFHFADLELRQTIGVGSFAQVRLVLHKPSQVPYALKVMYKGQVIAQDQVAHVMSEREVMSKCNHPFLLRMAASYQDADALYMLIELVPGGELFSLLRQQSYFQEPVAAFYAAIVIAAFEYLHDRQIVYRDLKPENLLLDAQGYIKVVDFGFAKEARHQCTLRRACATPHQATTRVHPRRRGHTATARPPPPPPPRACRLLGRPTRCAARPSIWRRRSSSTGATTRQPTGGRWASCATR